MIKSQAVIQITATSILVHFKNIGSRQKFERIRQHWIQTFPQSIWNKKLGAWELPPANFTDVKLYCEKMFWIVKVMKLPNYPKQPKQLSFNLLKEKAYVPTNLLR